MVAGYQVEFAASNISQIDGLLNVPLDMLRKLPLFGTMAIPTKLPSALPRSLICAALNATVDVTVVDETIPPFPLYDNAALFKENPIPERAFNTGDNPVGVSAIDETEVILFTPVVFNFQWRLLIVELNVIPSAVPVGVLSTAVTDNKVGTTDNKVIVNG